MRRLRIVLIAAVAGSVIAGGAPAAAAAPRPLSALCDGAALASGLAGKACRLVEHGHRVLSAAGQLARGHIGGAVSDVLGGGPTAVAGGSRLNLTALSLAAASGAAFALHETAKLIDSTSRPQLTAVWFSRVYWQVAAIAVLLTVPFLFAAAIQALIRSDLTLLVRSAFLYLPLAMLAVAVCAQLTSLLLTATDELSRAVSSAAGRATPRLLAEAGTMLGVLSLARHSPFPGFFIAVFTICGAIMLWTELMMRDAAVYVIVAMLPLAFAALVWPARRVWALRSVELLVALILSKLAMVTVLTLAGAALKHGSPVAFMSGFVLLLLGVFAPWAMLRLVPLAELATSAAGRLGAEAYTAARPSLGLAGALAGSAHDWASATTAGMRRDAVDATAAAATTPVHQLADGTAEPDALPGGNTGELPPGPDAGGPAPDPGGPAPDPGGPAPDRGGPAPGGGDPVPGGGGPTPVGGPSGGGEPGDGGPAAALADGSAPGAQDGLTAPGSSAPGAGAAWTATAAGAALPVGPSGNGDGGAGGQSPPEALAGPLDAPEWVWTPIDPDRVLTLGLQDGWPPEPLVASDDDEPPAAPDPLEDPR